MCSIANLFDKNIRKLDAKKRIFLPRMLKEKLIWLKNTISVIVVEL